MGDDDHICAQRVLYDRNAKDKYGDPIGRSGIKWALMDADKDSDLKSFGGKTEFKDLVVIVPEGDPDDKDDPYAFC